MKPEIPILYHQDRLLLVNKPSGLLVHRSEIDRHETQFLLQRVRDQIGQRVFAVNRLDKPTSGLTCLTSDAEVVASANAALQAEGACKLYLAVVRGIPPEFGLIDKPLKRIQDDHDPRSRTGPPQDAITEFRRLATVELPVRVDRYATSRYSLIALNLITGRRHQLRRHLKSLSHPVIGDSSYGKGAHNRLFREQFGANRLLLHAWHLAFQWPPQGPLVTVTAPPDECWQRVLAALGWSLPAPEAVRSAFESQSESF